MRWAALALLLLCGSANADTLRAVYFNAACNTENSLADGSGNNYTLQSTQTLSYSLTAKEGVYSATGFSGCCTSGQGGLIPAMANTSITVQAYVYLSSLAADQCIVSWCNGGAGDPAGLIISTTGNLKFYYAPSNVTISAEAQITAGAWYYVAIHTGGDTTEAWLAGPNPTAGFTPTKILNVAGGTYTNVGFMQIGRWAPTGSPAAANSYIDSISFRTGNIPTLPTAEMALPPLSSLISPYSSQGLFHFVSPRWNFK